MEEKHENSPFSRAEDRLLCGRGFWHMGTQMYGFKHLAPFPNCVHPPLAPTPSSHAEKRRQLNPSSSSHLPGREKQPQSRMPELLRNLGGSGCSLRRGSSRREKFKDSLRRQRRIANLLRQHLFVWFFSPHAQIVPKNSPGSSSTLWSPDTWGKDGEPLAGSPHSRISSG